MSVRKIGRAKRRGKQTDTFQREYTEPWLVVTDDPSVGVYAVITAAGLPAVSDPFGDDDDALVKDISAQETDNPVKWLVDVLYSTAAADKSQEAQNPLLEPATFTWDTERVETATQEDLDGLVKANSAGDPFDPPATDEAGIVTCDYSDNVPTFDALGRGPSMSYGLGGGVFVYPDASGVLTVIDEPRVTGYLYHTNETVFWGQAPHTVLMTRFRGQRNYRNGILYWQRSIQLKIDPNRDWTLYEPVDMGFRYWHPRTGSGELIRSDVMLNGKAATKPAFLDGSGGLISQSLAAIQVGAQYFKLSFRVKGEVNFNVLGLQTPGY